MSSVARQALRLVVMAKAPLSGYAKTRLIPALGEHGAAALAERLLHHTLEACVKADLGPVELHVVPGPSHPYWRDFPLPRAVTLTGSPRAIWASACGMPVETRGRWDRGSCCSAPTVRRSLCSACI